MEEPASFDDVIEGMHHLKRLKEKRDKLKSGHSPVKKSADDQESKDGKTDEKKEDGTKEDGEKTNGVKEDGKGEKGDGEEAQQDDDESMAAAVDLYERFYQYGIQPDWLDIHRVINMATDRKGKVQYFVKWRSLPYEQCTWEDEEFLLDIPNGEKQINFFNHLK